MCITLIIWKPQGVHILTTFSFLIFKQPFLSKYMAGYISGKQYWRVCYWRLPKHFPLLLQAEGGTFCCTGVHQACFLHFPLICCCAPRSSIVLGAVLLGVLSVVLLIAGKFLLLAHSGSWFINVCDGNTGSHVLVLTRVGFSPKCWRAVLCIFICMDVFFIQPSKPEFYLQVWELLCIRAAIQTLLQSHHGHGKKLHDFCNRGVPGLLLYCKWWWPWDCSPLPLLPPVHSGHESRECSWFCFIFL